MQADDSECAADDYECGADDYECAVLSGCHDFTGFCNVLFAVC